MKLLFSKRRIASAIKRLAGEIERDYRGSDLTLVGVEKGAFIFLADLVRQLSLPLEIAFVSASSYLGAVSCGSIVVREPTFCSFVGKHVLLVEDIVDTGLTARVLIEYFEQKGVASVKFCTLLDKPARRRVPIEIHYRGFVVPDVFVVGYGLDYDGKYRSLPEIYRWR